MIWKQKLHVFYLPCASFNIAAVMKMLRTFLKTSPSNTELNWPEPFQAMIIIALIEKHDQHPH